MENENDKDKRDSGLPCNGDEDRNRLYFVAESEVHRRREGVTHGTGSGKGNRTAGSEQRIGNDGPARLVGVSEGARLEKHGIGQVDEESEQRQPARLLADAEISGSGAGLCDSGPGAERGIQLADRGELGDTLQPGLEGHSGDGPGSLRSSREIPEPDRSVGAPDVLNGFWRDAVWLPCRDGKARPTKPGLFPLVAGTSGGVVRGGNNGASFNPNATAEARVGRLRGYGNSIVSEVAAEFIKAYLEVSHD